MVLSDGSRKGPPYVSFRSWETLLDRLRLGMLPLPQRLDSSIWSRMSFSGSTESALKGALVFLGLTDENYRPTRVFNELLDAFGDDETRRSIVHRLVEQAYRPLLPTVNLARATRGEVREAFFRAGSGTQTAEKAVSFFVALASDAEGFELHPRLNVRKRASRAGKRTHQTKIGRNSIDNKNGSMVAVSENIGHSRSEKKIHPLLQSLVDELPALGQEWPIHRKQMFQTLWDQALSYLYGAPDDPIPSHEVIGTNGR